MLIGENLEVDCRGINKSHLKIFLTFLENIVSSLWILFDSRLHPYTANTEWAMSSALLQMGRVQETEQLRMLSTLPKNPGVQFPVPTLDSSQPPITPVQGLSKFLWALALLCIHPPHTNNNNKINLEQKNRLVKIVAFEYLFLEYDFLILIPRFFMVV